jgi:hypothetical protein
MTLGLGTGVLWGSIGGPPGQLLGGMVGAVLGLLLEHGRRKYCANSFILFLNHLFNHQLQYRYICSVYRVLHLVHVGV